MIAPLVDLVHLTELREQLDVEIDDRRRLRARVVSQINAERARLARIHFLARGARMSLGELIEHATTPDPPTNQEGHD